MIHQELAIALGASRFDPAHINPDFLRYNEVVSPDWIIDPPVIAEPGFSLVDYINGVSLSAGNDDLRISQVAPALGMDEIVAPTVAQRYLEMAPWPVEYQYVRIDLRGVIPVGDIGIDPRFSPMNSLSQLARFGEIPPNVQVRVAYGFPDKAVTMYISEASDGGAVTELRFSGQIYRHIDRDMSAEEQGEFIKSIVGNWTGELDLFDELASQFFSGYVQKEGGNDN